VKGEAEESVAALGFTRLVALRPSLLLGDRAESRAGERVARALAPAFNPLLVGGLRRYRAVSAEEVAAAAVAAARDPAPGRLVWEYEQIHAAAGSD
jgi:uncharacterized protein YbjT (DUF2867 family)